MIVSLDRAATEPPDAQQRAALPGFAEIRRHCSKESGYLTAETPVIEALFRIFLANGNQPIDLDTIREQLAAYVPPGERPRSYTPELLQRLLETDNRYGLRRFELTPA